ncbi:unnamed protein product [Sphenostylis stenocarpa]|uniref:Uncharacterized protein n=1 Tax=Sphenostylis stenocarpa TaxID=92480 RepID=A0AA86VK59_9FABA|nr:unnamed protein product [Sphenostylis stenocarpa]
MDDSFDVWEEMGVYSSDKDAFLGVFGFPNCLKLREDKDTRLETNCNFKSLVCSNFVEADLEERFGFEVQFDYGGSGAHQEFIKLKTFSALIHLGVAIVWC